MRRILAALAFLLFATSAYAQSGIVPSVWKNHRGSMMYVNWPLFPNGFGGAYVNLAEGYKNCYGTPYPMSGRIDGNKIAFTVIWNNFSQNCQSRTDWTGTISGNKIKTRWIITLDNGKVFKRGRDYFTRQ
jgi:hypothetical protein